MNINNSNKEENRKKEEIDKVSVKEEILRKNKNFDPGDSDF